MRMQLSLVGRTGGVARVRVQGAVSHPHEELVDPLTRALGADAYKGPVMLDLGEVVTLDSSGVGWLLQCDKRFREQGGTMVLHSLSPEALRVCRVLKLQRVLRIEADEIVAERAASEPRQGDKEEDLGDGQ